MDAKAKFLKKQKQFTIITTDSLNRRAVLPQGCNRYHLSIGSMFCMLGHVRHFTLFTQGGCTASHTYDTSLAVFLSNRVLYIMATMTTTNLQHSPFSFDDLVLQHKVAVTHVFHGLNSPEKIFMVNTWIISSPENLRQ